MMRKTTPIADWCRLHDIDPDIIYLGVDYPWAKFLDYMVPGEDPATEWLDVTVKPIYSYRDRKDHCNNYDVYAWHSDPAGNISDGIIKHVHDADVLHAYALGEFPDALPDDDDPDLIAAEKAEARAIERYFDSVANQEGK